MIRLFAKLVGSNLPKVLRRLVQAYRLLVPQPLTSSEKQFVERNTSFWATYSRDESGDGYVLVEHQSLPVVFLSDASFASILCQARNLKPLFMLPSAARTTQKQILASYPNATFFYLPVWRNVVWRIRAILEARRVYRSLEGPQSLLDLEIDGFNVGHIIYDAVLITHGYATIEKIDHKVFDVLHRFFVAQYTIKHLLGKYRIEAAVISQLMGLMSGTLSKYLLSRGTEVFNRVGDHQFCLMKFRALADMVHHTPIPLPEHFQEMMDTSGDTIIENAEAYLEKRFGGGVSRTDAVEAFGSGKTLFTDRATFCARYGLDAGNPLVFVMLHQFNDWPHWNYPKKMLFRDYYHWFVRTLEIAETVDSVNWVFKEHPCAKYYPTQDLDVGDVVGAVDAGHILLLDDQADFNTGSLRFLAHAVVTGMGTAGLEFSGYGIPSVLASECYYSDFGFTIQPETTTEYESCLRHIDQLQPLSIEQRRTAKGLAYFYFRIGGDDGRGNVYHFCPRFEEDQISEWTEDYSEQLWARAAADFLNPGKVDEMKVQVRVLTDFIRDESRVQYYDMDRFRFTMRSTVGMGVSGAGRDND